MRAESLLDISFINLQAIVNALRKYPFLLFLTASMLLRILSFHFSVIDHDESTYLVIANQMLKGDILYVDVWDTKPPGIFLLFAGIISVIGKSIVMLRMCTAGVVAFSAYLLFKTKKAIGSTERNSLISGLFLIVFLSMYRFGMAGNTEIFFGSAIMLGLYLIVRYQFLFLAGLAWGVAMSIKTVAVFDLFAFFIGGLFLFLMNKISFINGIVSLFKLFLGFIIPTIIIGAYYYSTGYFSEYVEACWVVPSRYSSEIIFGDVINFIFNTHLKFFPFFILLYWNVIVRFWKNRKLPEHYVFIIPWLIMTIIAAILPGKYFNHYILQMAIPICWLSADIIELEGNWVNRFLAKTINRRILYLVVILGIGINQMHFFVNPDKSRIIANEMRNELNESDVFYAGNRYQVLYFLLDSDPLTKYVHPSLLTYKSHIRTLEIDPNKEFEKIFNKEPKVVVLSSEHPNTWVRNELSENYRKDEQKFENLLLYRRMN